MSEESIKIGYIVSVAGSRVSGILISPDAAGPDHDEAALTDAVQIGKLIKVFTPRSVAFGVVSSLEVRNPSSPPSGSDARILEIELFGEAISTDVDGEGGFVFQRGVSVYPGLGQTIYATTTGDLARIYSRPDASNIRIGSLYQDDTLPAYAVTDDLLGKHFAVLGTTGTGKSCTVALLLRSILTAHPQGHVVLLDPHGEYGSAFGDMAEMVSPDSLQLPYWLLNSEEALEVMCSKEGPQREGETAIVKEAIMLAKRAYAGEGEAVQHITVDTPVPYRLGGLLQTIDDMMGQLDNPESSLPYLRVKARIEGLRNDPRFSFMFSGISVRDSMGEVLSRILRLPVAGKPVTIIDLSGVPSEIVDVVVSLLCRLVFDFALWSERANATPVLFVCEEAHRYIPRDVNKGFEPTRKAISLIAKEGRKYGVSLCLVTQRPSELSETILSQCNTLFSLRMANDQDQEFVQRALPESAAGLLNALPALRTQEAIVVGEGVNLPMRIRFDSLTDEQRPRSATAPFSAAWDQGRDNSGLVDETIDRWRRQVR